jgi:hypothetical protein
MKLLTLSLSPAYRQAGLRGEGGVREEGGGHTDAFKQNF